MNSIDPICFCNPVYIYFKFTSADLFLSGNTETGFTITQSWIQNHGYDKPVSTGAFYNFSALFNFSASFL